MKIGVLALQGAFVEHIAMLRALGAEAVPVRLPEALDGLDGLIIPGGESTAIGKLMVGYALIEPLRTLIDDGLPVYGTCAGMILLARDTDGTEQPLLGSMDIVVKRNAFGRQLQSFEQELAVPLLGDALFHAVFIRAPAIEHVGPDVSVLATLDDETIVAAEQEALLVTAFHPELAGDTRLHAHFLDLCARRQTGAPASAREGSGDE